MNAGYRRIVNPLLDPIQCDPVRQEELTTVAGWGNWPTEMAEALFVGCVLGFWCAEDVADTH